MSTLGERIKWRRTQLGITQEELAALVGYKSKTSINKVEADLYSIKLSMVKQFAKALQTTPDYIMGFRDTEPTDTSSVRIPILGKVAAGVPIFASDYCIGTIEISKELAETGSFFGLKIAGDSMSPQIMDGDTVIVKHQETADNNSIVIALIDGEESTCKKLLKMDNGIVLLSLNPAYSPRTFSTKDVMQNKVSIIGKVVEVRREII